MAKTKYALTTVETGQRYRVYTEIRSLFGIISSEVKVKEEFLGNEVYIWSEEPVNAIYFNGKKLKVSQSLIKGEKC